MSKIMRAFSDEDHDKVRQVMRAGQELGHVLMGPPGWIAKQNGGGWSFVIGENSAHIEDDDLWNKSIDDLAKDCFLQLMKYEYDSPTYWASMIGYYRKSCIQRQDQLNTLHTQLTAIQEYLHKLVRDHPEAFQQCDD